MNTTLENTTLAVSNVLRYSGLGFGSLDHAVTEAIIEHAGASSRMYNRVAKAVSQANEACASTARIQDRILGNQEVALRLATAGINAIAA